MREDGTKASIHHDYSRAQSIARELEQEYGLQLFESSGSETAMRGERPGERDSEPPLGGLVCIPVPGLAGESFRWAAFMFPVRVA